MYIETEHKGSRRFQKIEKGPATTNSFVPPDQYCSQSERSLSGIQPGHYTFGQQRFCMPHTSTAHVSMQYQIITLL
jgi:hypothetical protein